MLNKKDDENDVDKVEEEEDEEETSDRYRVQTHYLILTELLFDVKRRRSAKR